MIAMYIDVEHKTWDRIVPIVPYVTFAYNTAVQVITRFTPFRLLYGREVQTMLDSMLPCQDADEFATDAGEFAERAEEARQLARLHIGQQQQQQADARRYNIRHREVSCNPGDQVWAWTPVRRRGLSEKLLSRYFGPIKCYAASVTRTTKWSGTQHRRHGLGHN